MGRLGTVVAAWHRVGVSIAGIGIVAVGMGSFVVFMTRTVPLLFRTSRDGGGVIITRVNRILLLNHKDNDHHQENCQEDPQQDLECLVVTVLLAGMV